MTREEPFIRSLAFITKAFPLLPLQRKQSLQVGNKLFEVSLLFSCAPCRKGSRLLNFYFLNEGCRGSCTFFGQPQLLANRGILLWRQVS